jgi:hypothetical protein
LVVIRSIAAGLALVGPAFVAEAVRALLAT